MHRPHVAGIHGRETEGAYSIVLAGGYEDDKVGSRPCLFKMPYVLQLSLLKIFRSVAVMHFGSSCVCICQFEVC